MTSRSEATPAAWQPIETAPKDGAWFIALENGEAYPCQWQEDEPDEGPHREGWWDFFNQSYENPTHWVSAPAPPERESDGSSPLNPLSGKGVGIP